MRKRSYNAESNSYLSPVRVKAIQAFPTMIREDKITYGSMQKSKLGAKMLFKKSE